MYRVAMRTTFCALAAVSVVLALGACGESSQDKAKNTVCDARADISKQIDALKGLTPATVTKDAVTQPLNAIKNDLTDITGAQSDLSSDRRSQIQAANKAFTSSIQQISSQFLKSLSASDAKAQLTTAVQQLEASYTSTLARVNCG
ncbi:hypothetical protein [Capillimicrobium parvum]|uniref:Lipoprotein n=1 Tax=Capillimicrobium parvum TaxID=2884022 RepID=A0A9E6Y314_9ACTN|nr:hypothetical protein [Capillimicrobium parvum]UGS38693.1 hypothetical protein DSM104329_05123 [Capillimicrobium parvum]